MHNVFLYWEGPCFKLIKLLRNFIYLGSKYGVGYNVHLVTPENIKSYIKDLPECFDRLYVSYKADYVRVYLIQKYGGIWLDSDTLVVDKLDILFEHLEKANGFLVRQDDGAICNGIFGSVAQTELLNRWLHEMNSILKQKGERISWGEIGNDILTNLHNHEPSLFEKYIILDGSKSIYPVSWQKIEYYLEADYTNHIKVEKDNQPLIVLTNVVYHRIEEMDFDAFLSTNSTVLNYFLNKAFKKAKGHLGNISLTQLASMDSKEVLKIMELIKIEHPFYGNIIVIKNDKWVGETLEGHREWEPHLKNLFAEYGKDETTIIDIGAFYGTHTIVLSKIFPNSDIHAFEINPLHAFCCSENCNEMKNVTVHTVGLSDCRSRHDIAYWNADKINHGNCSIINPSRDRDMLINIQQVNCVPLDEYNFKNVSLVKIDVEEHEINVLKGALNTIKSSKPTIIVEIFKESYESFITSDIWSKLEAIGYTISHINDDDYILYCKKLQLHGLGLKAV